MSVGLRVVGFVAVVFGAAGCFAAEGMPEGDVGNATAAPDVTTSSPRTYAVEPGSGGGGPQPGQPVPGGGGDDVAPIAPPMPVANLQQQLNNPLSIKMPAPPDVDVFYGYGDWERNNNQMTGGCWQETLKIYDPSKSTTIEVLVTKCL